ncbi:MULTISPECIES: DUF6093 family protein [unclassified Streptomyces]|uniref:DUF6093 family protein n=1 Tax=unclassified Streptomyces TaxID=2593676 RepID=UPI002DDC31E4|nr:DUF6093 family protein [Streptomyces sp. NBC_01751]WSD29297.1 hypothetical protein OHA26_41100 [Streptomyces sp. NBC_01751]
MSTPPHSEGLSLAAVAPIVETRILVDTVEIFRPGEPVFDPDSDEYHSGPDTIIYTGSGAIFASGRPGWSCPWRDRRTPTTRATGTDC